MDRQTYNTCLAQGLKGKRGLSKEERQIAFCIESKVCSGKITDRAEAKQVCLSQPPKEPKARKSRKRSQDMGQLATCLSQAINITSLTQDNLRATLAEALQQCDGRRAKTKLTPTLTPEQTEALQVISQMKTDYSDGSIREMPVMR